MDKQFYSYGLDTVNKMIGPMHVNCWGLMDDEAQRKQN